MDSLLWLCFDIPEMSNPLLISEPQRWQAEIQIQSYYARLMFPQGGLSLSLNCIPPIITQVSSLLLRILMLLTEDLAVDALLLSTSNEDVSIFVIIGPSVYYEIFDVLFKPPLIIY